MFNIRRRNFASVAILLTENEMARIMYFSEIINNFLKSKTRKVIGIVFFLMLKLCASIKLLKFIKVIFFIGL